MKSDGASPPGHNMCGLIDISCHILPGIEDGPKNMSESVKMLRIAHEEGIRTIVATPRYSKGRIFTEAEKLDRLVEQLNQEARKIDEDLKIYLGREIEYSGESHEKLVMGTLDSMADSKYVMLRFNPAADFEVIAEAIR
ncbi:MAG: CpsB/CapC family capsule biosynthesis tyrosine phosphatase, partial [Coprococcus sp.]